MPARDLKRESALLLAIADYTESPAVTRYVRTLRRKKSAVTLRDYDARRRALLDDIYLLTRRGTDPADRADVLRLVHP